LGFLPPLAERQIAGQVQGFHEGRHLAERALNINFHGGFPTNDSFPGRRLSPFAAEISWHWQESFTGGHQILSLNFKILF
jgi:hypothetical protein